MPRLFFALLLLIVPQPLLAAWQKAMSDHFIVYSEGTPASVRDFAQKLENFDAVLTATTGKHSEAGANRLIVFMVDNVNAVQRQMGGEAKNVAGFYMPRIWGTYAIVPRRADSGQFSLDSETVLFHEYTHHFMLRNAPAAYPAWYVEGFAEFYSTTEFRRDGTVWVGTPANHRAYGLMLLARYPLERLFVPDDRKMSPEDIESYYGWSWLLMHYLRYSKERSGQLTKYLVAFADGAAPREAATGAFGPLDTLQKELTAYRDARKMTYSQLRLAKMPDGPIEMTTLSVAESAMMPLYIRSTRESRTEEEIASTLGEARKLAARYPAEPMALDLVAEFELDSAHFDEAKRANDAVLAARPADVRALMRAARIGTERLQAAKSTTDAEWRAVRSLIVKANRAAPDDPYPLYAFYRWHIDSGTTVPAVAVSGLQRAVELAPQVVDMRFMLAARLISDGKADLAKRVLAPLVNDPHSPEVRAAARKMIETAAVATPKPTQAAE